MATSECFAKISERFTFMLAGSRMDDSSGVSKVRVGRMTFVPFGGEFAEGLKLGPAAASHLCRLIVQTGALHFVRAFGSETFSILLSRPSSFRARLRFSVLLVSVSADCFYRFRLNLIHYSGELNRGIFLFCSRFSRHSAENGDSRFKLLLLLYIVFIDFN
jgi:hypothetical protein